HDGVLYIYGFGDEVLAFDAKTGSLLWRYRRHLPEGAALTSKKTMALWGDRIYAATSDLHLIALDAKTGRPIWDKPITDRPGFRNPGGPLVADGVVMQGLTTQEPGGGLIVALDAATGEYLWTFQTIAQPGAPDDSWNGLPADERRGGSVWTSGSYDSETGLALWGTAQTYDTGPLLVRKEGERNDALYTDTTLAIVPRTGELKWFFQHMKNDQWDLDWVFDRTVATLEVAGEPRRVVMTSGKEGLFDVLDAKTGKYIKTVDMGLQDFVTAIDPETGEKIIDPAKLPQKDKTVFMCPHAGGGRNWSPTSFNPDTQDLFVVARDVCMAMVPASPGFLSAGVNIDYAAPPDGDGKYGILQALDMREGKVKWEVRQRAPYDMGVLTTAGGVLFTGSVDRQVMAYDQETGREIWRMGLAGVPNASPITYAVDGRQYVAMVVGHGNPLSFGIPTTPELVMPPVDNSSIYVFALPIHPHVAEQ
ncbi:MAG TPA: PQQ-binding-like beta-propeller repeat protein, partial [Alteraurantiacibacter sp.]